MDRFLWILYDTYFSVANLSVTQSALVQASKIQTVAFLAFLGAFGTAIAVYAIERHFSASPIRHLATQ
jgi:ABC-type Fe3+-siderophore transport system permease subunit